MTDGEAQQDATFLSQVLADAPVPLWVIDAGGLVLLANRSAVRFLGHSSEADVQGGSSHELLHRHRPDGSPYPTHECPIVRSSGSEPASEWFITRAGDVRPVRWSTRPVGTDGAVLLSFSASDPRGDGRSRGADGGRRGAPSSPAGARAHLRAALLRSIEGRAADPTFSTADLADEARMSVRSVQALFAEVGTSPASAIRRRRLERARAFLEHGHPVQVAFRESGFLDPGTFARSYRQRYGHSPSRTSVTEGAGPDFVRSRPA